MGLLWICFVAFTIVTNGQIYRSTCKPQQGKILINDARTIQFTEDDGQTIQVTPTPDVGRTKESFRFVPDPIVGRTEKNSHQCWQNVNDPNFIYNQHYFNIILNRGNQEVIFLTPADRAQIRRNQHAMQRAIATLSHPKTHRSAPRQAQQAELQEIHQITPQPPVTALIPKTQRAIQRREQQGNIVEFDEKMRDEIGDMVDKYYKRLESSQRCDLIDKIVKGMVGGNKILALIKEWIVEITGHKVEECETIKLKFLLKSNNAQKLLDKILSEAERRGITQKEVLEAMELVDKPYKFPAHPNPPKQKKYVRRHKKKKRRFKKKKKLVSPDLAGVDYLNDYNLVNDESQYRFSDDDYHGISEDIHLEYDDKYYDDQQSQSVYGLNYINHIEALFVIEMTIMVIISVMIISICYCLLCVFGVYFFKSGQIWKVSCNEIENIVFDNV